MKRFVMGDPHGAALAINQVLTRSFFNYENDQLIVLGDVADGWPDVVECFEKLLQIPNLIYILGNHDVWLYDWLTQKITLESWTRQGGQASINSYLKKLKESPDYYTEMKKRHIDLLENAYSYYETTDKKIFVHGGFNWHFDIKDQSLETLTWDRHLYSSALMWEHMSKKADKPIFGVKNYQEVFIGHTSTCYTHPDMLPVHASNVWNLDQGAGWEGKLTIMDIDTKEYWQSDLVKTLYPNIKGRHES